jgi:transcriptional regulator GlxA family with amidase domain
MEVRLQRACDLLSGTLLSVKEVRHEIGIPDGANFARHFRRRFAMTPSGFRKIQKDRMSPQKAGSTN